MSIQSINRVEVIQPTATAQVWAMGELPVPGTLWVRPGAGNTLTVEYSTDNGANYQAVSLLTGATAYSETLVGSGFTHLRITPSGVQGGTWGIS